MGCGGSKGTQVVAPKQQAPFTDISKVENKAKDPNISNAETGQDPHPNALQSEMSRNEKVESVSSKAVTNKFPLGKADPNQKQLPPIKDEELSEGEEEEFEDEEVEFPDPKNAVKTKASPAGAAPVTPANPTKDQKLPQKDPVQVAKPKEGESVATASDAGRTFLGVTQKDQPEYMQKQEASIQQRFRDTKEEGFSKHKEKDPPPSKNKGLQETVKAGNEFPDEKLRSKYNADLNSEEGEDEEHELETMKKTAAAPSQNGSIVQTQKDTKKEPATQLTAANPQKESVTFKSVPQKREDSEDLRPIELNQQTMPLKNYGQANIVRPMNSPSKAQMNYEDKINKTALQPPGYQHKPILPLPDQPSLTPKNPLAQQELVQSNYQNIPQHTLNQGSSQYYQQNRPKAQFQKPLYDEEVESPDYYNLDNLRNRPNMAPDQHVVAPHQVRPEIVAQQVAKEAHPVPKSNPYDFINEESGKNPDILHAQNMFRPGQSVPLARENYLGAMQEAAPIYSTPGYLDDTVRTSERMKQSIYGGLSDEIIETHEILQLRKEFQALDDRERLNPSNVMVRIIFIHAFKDSENHKYQKYQLQRKLFGFFMNKNSNLLDVKERIKKEFGWETEQTQFYHRYLPLLDRFHLFDIEDFDLEEDILICVTNGEPKIKLKVILRDPFPDIKIDDVKDLNCDETLVGDPAAGHYHRAALQPKVFEDPSMDTFSLDKEKLVWPAYRNWTEELSELSDIIVKSKLNLLSYQTMLRLQAADISVLTQNEELDKLIVAEQALGKLMDDFKQASLYAVHMIVQKNPTPLNLFNLYGDDGDKFIIGGILIRKAKGWTICGTQAGGSENNSKLAATNSSNEISGKLAALNVRNLALLRCQLPNLVVPLAAIVDYFGIRFETQSLCPLSLNSLVYGSDTDGLLFENNDINAETLASKIGEKLNIAPHNIEERATGNIKQVYLPYNVQLHMNPTKQGKEVFLVNPMRLFPSDESVRMQDKKLPNSHEVMSRQLRPEQVISNNKGQPAQGYKQFAWKKPVVCDECGAHIMEYVYYYYSKESVAVKMPKLYEYYCCQSCYQELLPTERFKVPLNKIQRKELPEKDRQIYWMHLETQVRSEVVPFENVSLNPDAFMALNAPRDKQKKEFDQEEVIRAGQKVRDEQIDQLVEDLNSVDVDPLTPQQLKQVLHSRGISIRNLGQICTKAQLNNVREIAVTDILARSIKLLCKDGLSFLAEDSETGYTSANIKKYILHYFVEIFAQEEFKGSSQHLWDFVTEHARKKYQVTVERDILSKIHLNSLLLNVCEQMNIKLAVDVRQIDFMERFDPQTGKGFLTVDDFESIHPIVKDYREKLPGLNLTTSVVGVIPVLQKEAAFPCSLNLVLETARKLDEAGKRTSWFMKGGHERTQATILFRLAVSICDKIYAKDRKKYAQALKEFAAHLESRHQESGRPQNSRWNRSSAIAEDDNSNEARYFYQTSLQIFIDEGMQFSVETAEIYTALARLFKNRPSEFQNYRETYADVNQIFDNLMTAIQIYETCLGFDHPETGDAYSKMALAYQENGKFSLASPWIRRAFTTFYKVFGARDPITISAYETLKVIEVNIDSKLDQVKYDDLPQVILAVEQQRTG